MMHDVSGTICSITILKELVLCDIGWLQVEIMLVNVTGDVLSWKDDCFIPNIIYCLISEIKHSNAGQPELEKEWEMQYFNVEEWYELKNWMGIQQVVQFQKQGLKKASMGS